MSARELITEHLDLWTGAMTTKSTAGRGGSSGKRGKIELTGIKKLRELILELAVRGKLVEQDPSDEPASVLLERIAEEKARLVKEGKVKKLGSTQEDTHFHPIPAQWTWVNLGELTSLMDAGWSPACPAQPAEPNAWGVLKTTAIQVMKYLEVENKKLPDKKSPKEQYEVHRGDILITRAGPKNRVGVSCIVKETRPKLMISDKIIRFHLVEVGFSEDYICLCLNTGETYRHLERAKSGMAESQMNISQDKLKSAPIPLCSANEQHRIVEKVDELMALCDLLEQQVGDQLEAHEVLVDTLLDALTRSADADEVAENWARIAEHFDTLFTTEASIDKLKQAFLDLAADGKLIEFHVDKRPLKSMLSFGPRNGLSPKESSSDTGFKVLKLGATTKGKLDLTESKDADINEPESSHLWLKNGDILIQRGNAATHVGCNVLVEEDQPTFIYPDLMMKIRVKEIVDPKFISAYLSAPQSRQFMWERMTGTSGTMPKISKKVVEAIPIALPDIETQQATVEKVDELMALCERLKACLAEAGETRTQLAEAVVEKAVY